MSRFFVSASTDDTAPHDVSCKEIAGADLLSMWGPWRRVAAGPAFGVVRCETHYVAPDSSLAAPKETKVYSQRHKRNATDWIYYQVLEHANKTKYAKYNAKSRTRQTRWRQTCKKHTHHFKTKCHKQCKGQIDKTYTKIYNSNKKEIAINANIASYGANT